MLMNYLTIVFGLIIDVGYLYAQEQNPIIFSKDGKLQYHADSLGNQIPDFSFAGYQAGQTGIPAVKAKIIVPKQSGDATASIQAAINYVGRLPLDASGFRGAVQLEAGTYQVSGTLRIQQDGIVLRGAGFLENETKILGIGFTRATLIQVEGKDDRTLTDSTAITQQYVPVGAMKFKIAQPGKFKVGDKIQITRPSSLAWIKELGADHFGGGITSLGWKPNQRDIHWERTITAIDQEFISIDAPLTSAIDQHFGSGYVQRVDWPGRIQQVGIEGLRLESAFDSSNHKDEDHRWMAITLNHLSNAWVRQVQFQYFAGSSVYVLGTASKVTVEDCISLTPISEIAGQRRRTFFNKGQQVLFQRCYAEQGYHDFAVGFMAAGPNAFVQCESVDAWNFSGAVDSWASGVLFDIVNVEGQALRFSNRGQDGQGAGWTAANSVFWQSSAALVENQKPPTAQNWAFGTWAQFQGNGFWDQSNEHIQPRSLYYAQLAQRLGEEIKGRMTLLPVLSEASSSPSVKVAAELTKEAYQPNLSLLAFIREAHTRNPLPSLEKHIKRQQTRVEDPVGSKNRVYPLLVANGWLQRHDAVQTGEKADVQWWSGNARRYATDKSKIHITRFVPGEEGLGLTDNLTEVAEAMKAKNMLSIDHNYGLWYDRRRDDHERIQRIDGDVWPPFYELPFARTGRGKAFDGLSKYDLTKYNHFYWDRLRAFAELADQHKLILIHQNYFQHNILEAGAHYTDFPWRTANNVNAVGFPEPVPYAGDKRIFMDEQFYDVQHPVRRAIHRAYIRQSLTNFKDHTSVIQSISAEYTGPLHFVEFWLDVIKEWREETGYKPLISLSTTKDVQDQILADPVRSKEIQLIDIRYWHYQADGSVYAPAGGQHLAPRQHARLLKPKKTSAAQVYRAVSEYRRKYPDKAVLYHADNYPAMAWAIFMAGGSMAGIPRISAPGFLEAAAKMKATVEEDTWLLRSEEDLIIYATDEKKHNRLLQDVKGKYKVQIINPETGELLTTYSLGKKNESLSQDKFPSTVIIWLSKE